MKTPAKRPLKEAFTSTFHDRYSFNHFLSTSTTGECGFIELKNKKIASPSKKLKDFHKFVNKTILEFLEINEEVVFSYRKGKNILSAIEKHSQSTNFFQTDISNFFESISLSDVKNTIEDNTTKLPVSDIENYIDHISDLITIDEKLPVGFSTSPVLSNAVLFNFDNELNQYCETSSIHYSRYSDDIILSSNRKSSLIEASEKIQILLSKYFSGRININKSKTKFNNKGNRVKILGILILPNGNVTVDNSIKEDVEIKLHFFLNDRKALESYSGPDFEHTISKLSGTLNFISTIDSHYLDKLRKKCGNTTIDMFLHKSV
ncbi:MAG: reverse transcriptase domain-containing protein [Paracoccaceae bacterium]